MEIYSDLTVAYNSEGMSRLYQAYGWWNDDEDEDDTFTLVKKDKKKSESEKNAEIPTDPWDEKN